MWCMKYLLHSKWSWRFSLLKYIKILDRNTISIFQININMIYDINRMNGLFDKWPYMCTKIKK
jgi:hypothetical protein